MKTNKNYLIGLIDEDTLTNLIKSKTIDHNKFDYSHYNYVFDQFFNVATSDFNLLVCNPNLELCYRVEANIEKENFVLLDSFNLEHIENSNQIYFVSHEMIFAANTKNIFPESNFILSLAACHWLENSSAVQQNWGLKFCYNLALNIDLVIVQHYRMKEVVLSLLHSLRFTFLDDKVVEVPKRIRKINKEKNKLEIKRKLGQNEKSFIMVNSGGPWSWTDFENFLNYLKADIERLKKIGFKFIQLGLIQKDNVLELKNAKSLLNFLNENPALNDIFILEEDWQKASLKLNDYLTVADLGFLVSKDTLEGWQSVRQRGFDYVKYDIPFLCDKNSVFINNKFGVKAFVVESGNLNSYFEAFDSIFNSTEYHSINNDFKTDSDNLIDSKLKFLKSLKKINESKINNHRNIENIKPLIDDNSDFLNDLTYQLYFSENSFNEKIDIKFGQIKIMASEYNSIKKLLIRIILLTVGKFNLKKRKKNFLKMAKLNTLIIGSGYWGEKFVRNSLTSKYIKVCGIVDTNQFSLNKVSLNYGIKQKLLFNNLNDFFISNKVKIDLGIIMTPPKTHNQIISYLASKKINILCAKPLGASLKDLKSIIKVTQKNRVKLFVDHTFLFSEAFKYISDKYRHNLKIYSITSNRENPGGFRSDVNVLQDLLIHDISIVDCLLNCNYKIKNIFVSSISNFKNIEHSEIVLTFNNNIAVSLIASWISPTKVRHFQIRTSQEKLVWNDNSVDEKISIFHFKNKLKNFYEQIAQSSTDILEFNPKLKLNEPIQVELKSIYQNISHGKKSLNDIRHIKRTYTILYEILSKVKSG